MALPEASRQRVMSVHVAVGEVQSSKVTVEVHVSESMASS